VHIDIAGVVVEGQMYPGGHSWHPYAAPALHVPGGQAVIVATPYGT